MFNNLCCTCGSRMYKMKRHKNKQNWKTVCESTPEHSCDFSSKELHYLGVWLLRLRAESDQNVSSWVRKEFCPDKDGKIQFNLRFFHRPGGKDTHGFSVLQ